MSKMKVKVAAPSARPFLLNENHFTTLGFNQLIPVYSREVYPGDKFRITPDVFARAAVPDLPNFGDLKLNMRAFYVPFQQVFPHFNDFINGLPSANSTGTLFQNVNRIPVITQYDFTDLFYSTTLGLAVNVTGDLPYDIIIRSSSTSGYNYRKFRLTLKGKRVLQVFHSLGYNFDYIKDSNSNFSLSALPLLCFFKAYVDYYVPSRFQPTHPLHLYIRNLLTSENPTLSKSQIVDLFNNFFLYSDHNYFSDAWLSPNAPAPGLNNFGVQVANSTNSNPPYSTDFINSNGGVENNTSYVQLIADKVTDIGLSMLQKFSSFVRRNNFAGSRSIERLLARFGVHAPEQIMDMSQYLGSWTNVVSNIEITSNADTSSSDVSNLGEYAGMQYIKSQDDSPTFEVDVQRHGMVFVFASLGVPSMFVDGIRRHLLHLSPTSFYTPEFDGTILQSINGLEFTGRNSFKSDNDYNLYSGSGFNYSHGIGFVERYAEAKHAIDTVSGDFNLASLSQSIDPFILPRRIFNTQGYVLSSSGSIIDYSYFDINGEQNPMTAQKASTQEDSQQFNRIFRDLTGNADPYYLHFEFKVVAQRRMLNSDETAELLGYGEQKIMDSTGTNYN